MGFILRNAALKLTGILVALVCVVATLMLAVSPSRAQHLSFSQAAGGMDNLNVNCIVQDHSGYLWVGTENGLYRYDGVQFRKFGSSNGLRARTIQSLFIERDGTLFAGTTSGIYFQQRNGSFAEIHPPDQTSHFSQRIGTVFTQSAPGQVLAADQSGAFMLRRAAPEQWTAEPVQLENGPIWSVLYGPDGTLWYGCGSDLCRLAGGKTTHLGAGLHLPEERWLHLLISRDGRLWIRGMTHLGEVNAAEGKYAAHELPGQPLAAPYNTLAEDAQGRIAASQGAAFGLWDKGHWRMVTGRNGLSRSDISVLFVDREGSIWIGAVGHGLLRWVGQDSWEAYTVAEGLSDDIVWSSLRDRSGRLWIGTESGLNWIPPGANAARTWQSPGIETARAFALAGTADGNIWLGSGAGTLTRIDAKTLAGRSWKVPEVYHMQSDSEHRLWVATNGGLYVVDTAARDCTPRLVEDPAIAHPRARFRHVTLDSANRLWAASDEALYRLDSTGWHRIDPGLSGVIPHQIEADKQGNFWAAGEFAGVMRLRIVGDKVVESEHVVYPRLLSEQVVSLAVDDRGWVWIGQDAGVTVYDGRSWRSFDQDDGLIWNDTDGHALNEDRDGSMWIGTSGGLSHLVKPATVPDITLLTPTISQISFGSAAIADRARIPWSESPLAISVATLNFRDVHRLRIRYRLLGLEPEWVETDEANLRYPRLAPGDYRFQAETVDVTGSKSSAIVEINFRITPRWWQSWELRLGLALLVCIGIMLAWRWRVHLLVGQKRQLELAVQRRTEDLEREKADLLHAREQMRHFAEHDDLTGLWNHRIIIDRLRGEVDRARRDGTPLSLILVDLDHFKRINDTYGHPSGDVVLQEIGLILMRSVRSYDWVGRFGGEEFLLILPGSNFVAARLRAEQMRLAVQAAQFPQGESRMQVTASFGVASGFPTDYESIMHAADAALYRAKDNGRNCVVAVEIDPQATSLSRPARSV